MWAYDKSETETTPAQCSDPDCTEPSIAHYYDGDLVMTEYCTTCKI
ncbi:hypothetical protein ACFL7M_15650 [Thermodesulfobacteriota bacterium]